MRLIVPMMVGGIIGYITNWLAIKMLFRPHKEVRILGLKLPFTPGLIPKESKRVAKSIGETVGENLLSPKVITDALSKPENSENIKLWIKNNIYKLRENNNPINSLLMIQGNEKYESLINYLKMNIGKFIFSKINSEEFKNKTIDIVENLIYEKYGDEIQEFIFEQIRVYLNNIGTSEKLRLEIEGAIDSIIQSLKSDERTLSEVIPEDIIESINTYIDQEQEVIVNGILDIIKSPEIQNKLKTSLTDLVDQNMNKVITMFITPEQISEKIFSSLEKYIDSPEVYGTIIYIVKNSVEKILNHQVKQIAEDSLEVISNGDISIFSNIIIEYISKEDKQEKLFMLIKDKLESENITIRTKVVSLLSQGLDVVVNLNEVKEVIDEVIETSLRNILNQPISSIFITLEEDKIERVIEYLNQGFHSLMNSSLPDIITTMNISKIVEDQINSFEVEFTEKLILEIAKKELAAITWLGALLGIIMGLLTPLIQLLY